jgi:hypothetical protein
MLPTSRRTTRTFPNTRRNLQTPTRLITAVSQWLDQNDLFSQPITPSTVFIPLLVNRVLFETPEPPELQELQIYKTGVEEQEQEIPRKRVIISR